MSTKITDAELSKQVTVLNIRPPKKLYDRAVKKFGIIFEQGTIFTYGKKIYSAYILSEDLIKHELIHVRQQMEMGKDEWWDKYFEDDKFRFDQELEAYQRQYRWAKANMKDRTKVFTILQHCAKSLSSKMYGFEISHQEAINRIKE